MFLLSGSQREILRVASAGQTLGQGRVIPPRWEEAVDGFRFANKGAEGFLRIALLVVNSAGHEITSEIVFIFLAHARTCGGDQ